MKSLLILRHAQAVHFGDTSDHDRPLTEKGIHDAQRMARLFRGIRPTQILSSTAKRAVATAEQVVQVARLSTNIQTMRGLYESDVSEHLEILRSVAAAVDSVLLVGHNPTFEQLASTLVGCPVAMKTGALAIIALSIEHWAALNNTANASLLGLFCPAMLKKHSEGQD